jgi:lipase maturation factor 1
VGGGNAPAGGEPPPDAGEESPRSPHTGARPAFLHRPWLFAPASDVRTCWLFLRLLGVVYLIAFVSLWTQIHGLVGKQGILPIADFLDAVHRQAGRAVGYRELPTLLWFDASDAALHVLCGAGTGLALLLILDFTPAIALAGLWALYLSLAVGCQVFCEFQWDSLLLETGLLAIFLAPWSLWPRTGALPPPRIALWLLRWLLFRLLWESGVVKLASGDPSWSSLTALRYHYETQPLPTWIGWYAHQLPLAVQKLSTVIMFVIELVVPFCIFLGRRWRRWSFWPLAGLQCLIALTGNYTFFNLLTIALCVLLLDDEMLRLLPRRLARSTAARAEAGDVKPASRRPRGARVQALATALFAAFVVVTSGVRFAGQFIGYQRFPDLLLEPVVWTARLRSINSYGLFAVMTTRRPEIVVEGSRDGQTWLPYEFKWKPGDTQRRPGFVAPHMPRLDWQMWFAALNDYQRESWFWRFEQRLLEGSPAVRELLGRDPFAEAPPRWVRARLYDYQFTDRTERGATGAWWRRQQVGDYGPVVPTP